MNIEIKDINRITLTGRIISRDNEYEIKRADGEAVADTLWERAEDCGGDGRGSCGVFGPAGARGAHSQ